MANCNLCGREMLPYNSTARTTNDPRMDCGGDCWGCVSDIEGVMDPELEELEELMQDGPPGATREDFAHHRPRRRDMSADPIEQETSKMSRGPGGATPDGPDNR